MALIEKDIAAELIELRAAMALGHDYVTAVDLETALVRHLHCEQGWRAVVAEQTDARGLT